MPATREVETADPAMAREILDLDTDRETPVPDMDKETTITRVAETALPVTETETQDMDSLMATSLEVMEEETLVPDTDREIRVASGLVLEAELLRSTETPTPGELEELTIWLPVFRPVVTVLNTLATTETTEEDLATDREIALLVTDRETSALVMEEETLVLDMDREIAHLVTDRETLDPDTDRETSALVTDRETNTTMPVGTVRKITDSAVDMEEETP